MSEQPSASAGQPDFQVSAASAPRRGFIKQSLAIVIGGLVGLFPAAVGLATFLNPLRKSAKDKQRPTDSDEEGYYRVAPLNSLSASPQAYKIIASRKDAWNTFPEEAIGAVFLSRVSGNRVRAFNVICPHAGCRVDYRSGEQKYHCPCHNSSFDPDGKRDPKSPSARDLDVLDVKLVDGEVLVKFQNFKTGTEEKKAV